MQQILIKDVRKYYNITQQQLAERVGISQPLLSRIEAGTIRATRGTLCAIRRALFNFSFESEVKTMDYRTSDLVEKLKASNSREEALAAIKGANALQRITLIEQYEYKFRKMEVVKGKAVFAESEEEFDPLKLSATQILDALTDTGLLDY